MGLGGEAVKPWAADCRFRILLNYYLVRRRFTYRRRKGERRRAERQRYAAPPFRRLIESKIDVIRKGGLGAVRGRGRSSLTTLGTEGGTPLPPPLCEACEPLLSFECAPLHEWRGGGEADLLSVGIVLLDNVTFFCILFLNAYGNCEA